MTSQNSILRNSQEWEESILSFALISFSMVDKCFKVELHVESRSVSVYRPAPQ